MKKYVLAITVLAFSLVLTACANIGVGIGTGFSI